MTLGELKDLLTQASMTGTPNSTPVMIIDDSNGGLMLTPKKLLVEHHEDGDGSYTLWIGAEEA